MLLTWLPGRFGDKLPSSTWAPLPLKKILPNPGGLGFGNIAGGVVRVDNSGVSVFSGFGGLNPVMGKTGAGSSNRFISSSSTDELSISAAIASASSSSSSKESENCELSEFSELSELSEVKSGFENCSGFEDSSQLNKVKTLKNTNVPQTMGRRKSRSLALILRIETGS